MSQMSQIIKINTGSYSHPLQSIVKLGECLKFYPTSYVHKVVKKEFGIDATYEINAFVDKHIDFLNDLKNDVSTRITTQATKHTALCKDNFISLSHIDYDLEALKSVYTEDEIRSIHEVYHYAISHDKKPIPILIKKENDNKNTTISLVTFDNTITKIENITFECTFNIFSKSDTKVNRFLNVIEESLLTLNYDGLPQEMTFQTYITMLIIILMVFAFLIRFVSLFTNVINSYNLLDIADYCMLANICLLPLILF